MSTTVARGVAARIDELEAEVALAEQAFEQPEDPEARAKRYCREGVGPVVVLYVDCRTGGPDLPAAQCSRLESVLNRWLDLYGRCYGVDLDCTFALRTAAEILIETHNAVDVAQLLTTVPDRH
ncbi:hypothetical protein [Haloarchaeobius sp. HME9146]|uniref:hypothetical protein n=1 Tax=Haloarchaeobius sp. HME9146 TaxID=2978732 RepID=UPI0021C134BE|nr:hypothetical protein [Haloarchaeobius sp. HME9146]MCT9096677.1 hypothetical protein [Haloarchaeobius sp. HME9146]